MQINSPSVECWSSVCGHLQQRVPPDAFHRWFSGAQLVSINDERAEISVPNQIYQFWIEDNYLAPLRESFGCVVGHPVAIQFRIGPSPIAHANEETAGNTPHLDEDSHASPHYNGNGANGSSQQGVLNPRYTFEAYVVGASNQVAHAAAQAVSSSPGKTYNPLFIHGGVGLGKTHLMHAIGSAILQKKKASKVCYVTSEQFTNDFIEALQKNSLIKFRKRYRSLDVLMIDDIQFLGGKERSQEEFFHTFNSLFDGRKQIILTSDRPASEIASLEERLVSRFDWGMSAELMPPDIETRIAILRTKVAGMRVEISDELLQFLARRITSNVRRLEGALIRIASHASLCGKSLSIEEAEIRLKDLLHEEARRGATTDKVQKAVAEAYDLRSSDMTSKKRPAHIAFPRQIAMYLSRKLTRNSLQEIGAAFGGRDHGTVMHACKTIQEKMVSDEKLRQQIAYLEQKLAQG